MPVPGKVRHAAIANGTKKRHHQDQTQDVAQDQTP